MRNQEVVLPRRPTCSVVALVRALSLVPVLALLAGFAIVSCGSPASTGGGGGSGSEGEPRAEAGGLEPPALGDADAPVEIVEYGDYQ